MMIDLLVFDSTFYQRAANFSKKYRRYQQKDGTTNMYHIINAVKACGFLEVNSENIDQVMQALEDRAASKT